MLRFRLAIVTTAAAVASVFSLYRMTGERNAWLGRAAEESAAREALEARIAALEASRSEDLGAADRRIAALQSQLEVARGDVMATEAIQKELAEARTARADAEARLAAMGGERLVVDKVTGHVVSERDLQLGQMLAQEDGERQVAIRALIRVNRRVAPPESASPLNQGTSYVDPGDILIEELAQDDVQRERPHIWIAPAEIGKQVLPGDNPLNQGTDYVEPPAPGQEQELLIELRKGC